MSEEELIILQNTQYALDNVGSFDFGDFDFDDIQGLLDLYNKEKDLNNELQIRYKIEHDKYTKEKEKNKELENADLTTVYMTGYYDGENKWKDKIKEIYYNNEFMTTTGRIEFYQRELRKLLEEKE